MSAGARAGMVMTIERGSISPPVPRVPTFRNIGIRIEDDVW